MSKVTSKLQVTLPKAIAQRHHITAGSEIEFESSGSVIVLRPSAAAARLSTQERLRLFDAVSEWSASRPVQPEPADTRRDWTRDELYDRALAR